MKVDEVKKTETIVQELISKNEEVFSKHASLAEAKKIKGENINNNITKIELKNGCSSEIHEGVLNIHPMSFILCSIDR